MIHRGVTPREAGRSDTILDSCNRVFLNCYSDLFAWFVLISTPIFLGITNCISQFVHGANALEPLEGGPSSYTPLPKCSLFLLGSGSGRLGKCYKKHFSCSTRSLAFLPLKAILSSLCHCYKLKLCEFLQRSSAVCRTKAELPSKTQN